MQTKPTTESVALCADCQVGYHSPFGRFERVAVMPDGPVFLQRCSACGALWQESLHDAKRVTSSEAVALFHSFTIEGTGHGT